MRPSRHKRRSRRTRRVRPTPDPRSPRRYSRPPPRGRREKSARQAAAETASKTIADRQSPPRPPLKATESAASDLALSRFAHQALRPEPEETQEQRIHHDVLVDSADPIRRYRLDDTDQQARYQRSRHTAETAERYRDKGDDAERLADGRRDIKEGRDQRAGNSRG